MPEVVQIIHKNIVRRCRIPNDWVLPNSDVDQRMLIINVRAIREAFGHAASEMHHEIGGYMTGYPAYDDARGITFIYIDKVVRGIYESSPTHVTLFAQGYVAADAVCRADNTYVVGWYHSHPRLTVFFSGTDHNNHRHNFSRPYEVAMVVDPAQGVVPADGDSTTIQAALNQRNFAMFMWNRTVDTVIRASHSIVYVDTAPIDIAVASPAPPTDLGSDVATALPASAVTDVRLTGMNAEVVPTSAPHNTSGVLTVLWEESIYVHMLRFLANGLPKGVCVALYGVSQGTTAIHIQYGWQTDQSAPVMHGAQRLVGVVLMADDDLTTKLLQYGSQQQIRDYLAGLIALQETSVIFPLHFYLITAQQYIHTVVQAVGEHECVWCDGEPFAVTPTHGAEADHD
jgi:proteasome lid subunit RPN8/RPN11